MCVSNNNTTEQYWLLSVWHTCWISFLLARFSPPRSDQRHPMVRTVISLINWLYCRGHEGCVCMHVHSLTVFVVVLSFVPQVYSPRWVLFLVWVKCESKEVLFLTGGSSWLPSWIFFIFLSRPLLLSSSGYFLLKWYSFPSFRSKSLKPPWCCSCFFEASMWGVLVLPRYW